MSLAEQLEALSVSTPTPDQQTVFKKLYNRIISQITSCIQAGSGFDLAGDLRVYEITITNDTFVPTADDVETNSKLATRMDFILANKPSLEHYLDDQWRQSQTEGDINRYKFQINVSTIVDNSFLYKKTKKTLYILLQRVTR